MAQIRETIELLTRVLRSNGSSKLKAETFRLAKFNNDDVVESLWKLLFEIIYYLKFEVIDDVCVTAVTTFSKDELVVYVKRELQSLGFVSRDFARLPKDMTSGSRDLLLAFGWLMCKAGVIDKFMENCASPIAEDTAILHQNSADLDDSFRRKNQLRPKENLTAPQKVKYLLWLNGKLRLSLRNLYAIQREKANLAHKVHSATEGVSLTPERNHLSVMEVYMLRHPELLKKNLQLLEKDNERLQNLLVWKEKEDIFWQWMESVLDAKLLEGQAADQTGAIPEYYFSEDILRTLDDSRHRLTDAVTKYESILEHLERLWDVKKSEVSQKDLDSLIASIDLEISIQRANIALTGQEDSPPQRRHANQPRYSLVRPSPVQRRPLKTAPPTLDDVNATDIKKEIGRLNSVVDELTASIRGKQDSYQTLLNRMAGTYENLVCIPPVSRKL